MSLKLPEWAVDVEWSNHDALKEGKTALGCQRVIVAAAGSVKAQLLAAQIVASTHGMPTRTRLVEEE